jgi:sugar (pentulose or hexulose) kinase
MTYLIGTDIGTMGTKTVLVNTEGKVQAEAFQEYGVITPKQGWAEQWPTPWIDATYGTIKAVIETSKVNPKDIAGVSVSALYGGSGIPVDKKYQPIRPCLIWADRRATDECKWLRENIGVDKLYKITANVIDPYYGYTKMLWLKNHEHENWSKIHRLETPNAYVIRTMTGVESIDHSSAGNIGGIYELEKRDWSLELMDEIGIPRSFFPDKILSSEEIVGEISSEASKKSGLSKGTPICAGGIDAPVSALAGGAILNGDLASMLGTSMCNGIISTENRISPKMINFPYVVKAKKTLYSFTGISTAGFCVRWFRDQYGKEELEEQEKTGISAYKLLDKQAANIPIGSGDLIFLPHLMVGERAPYWDEHIRGAFLGLTVYHTRAHMFRAILEGVGYAMRYSIDAARDTGIEINRATLVDGGASSSLWRQIIADTTEIGFHYIPETLGAPMGDAILAGLGTHEITDHRVIEKWIGEKIPTRPKEENIEKYRKHYRLYIEAVEKLASYFLGF